MLASTLGDGALSLACPNTSSPPYRYSSKIILPAILEDQPLETTKVEAELDSFTKELNEVLTMDWDSPKDDKIVDAPVDPRFLMI